MMEQPGLGNLKYGIIYLYSDRSYSPGVSDPEAIVGKFVAPMKVEWVDDPGRSDLLLVARRFNVGNIGHYATVRLSLSRMNRSGGWFEAIRHFADALRRILAMGMAVTRRFLAAWRAPRLRTRRVCRAAGRG